MVLEMKKIYLLLFVSFVLFACSLSDVDDESDFAPTYDKLVGCWLSTENVAFEESDFEVKIKEEPFSSCREICFREDSSFTLRIKISKNTTTTFRNKDSSSVVTVNDSIVEAYGFYRDSSSVSQLGYVDDYRYFVSWVGSKGIPVFYEDEKLGGNIKNDAFYGGEFKLSIFYWRGNFENARLYWYNEKLAYHRSLQHSNCGNFGWYIDTTKYTLDSLRGK